MGASVFDLAMLHWLIVVSWDWEHGWRLENRKDEVGCNEVGSQHIT